MTIPNVGKEKIRDLIHNSIDVMTLGTDSTAVTLSDTDLGAEVSGIEKTPTISAANTTLNIQYELNSAEANGETLAEGGVKFDGDILLDRFVYPDYDKTSANSLVIIDVIKVL